MISVHPNHFCCGIMEVGNFAYIKTTGPKGLPHYHKVGSSWSALRATESISTEEEIRAVLAPHLRSVGAIICTTGDDQEYLDDILPGLGFEMKTFTNRTHEKGTVKFWFLDTAKYLERTK